MIIYRAMLDVPRELVRYVDRLLYRKRCRRGTPESVRRLTRFYQALFALAWFRSKPNIRLHGTAVGLSQATAYRYLHEAIHVLPTTPLTSTPPLPIRRPQPAAGSAGSAAGRKR